MRSQDYLEQLAAQGPADWGAAVRLLRDEVGSKAAGILSSVFGVTRRTGERWVAKAEGRTSQAVTPKAMAQVGLVGWAQRRYAANHLRKATRVSAGAVRVKYRHTGAVEPRLRHVGERQVTGVLRTALDRAAARIEAGDYVTAAELIDDGVMDAYGEGHTEDLSGVLDVDDYVDGFSIE